MHPICVFKSFGFVSNIQNHDSGFSEDTGRPTKHCTPLHQSCPPKDRQTYISKPPSFLVMLRMFVNGLEQDSPAKQYHILFDLNTLWSFAGEGGHLHTATLSLEREEESLFGRLSFVFDNNFAPITTTIIIMLLSCA